MNIDQSKSFSGNLPPVHAPMDQFKIDGGHLVIGGYRVADLVQKMGATPFYAYSSDLIRTRMSELRMSMPRDLYIHYAMKANPMPEVVGLMANLTDGIDVASESEMALALKMGASPEHISFAGPGKRDSEIEASIRARITLSIESERERDAVINTGKRLGIRPNITVRINPDFELKGSGMKMGGKGTQFGIDSEIASSFLQSLPSESIHFCGLHIYGGSNSLDSSAIIESQEKTFALARTLEPFFPNRLGRLNIGGGFGIPYFPGEKRLDITRIGTALSSSLSQFMRDFPGVRVNLELGRYLVGEAGIYVTRVIDRKVSRGQIFLVVDGGLHHHLSASGNFGQVIRKNYPVAVANRINQTDSSETEVVSIVGPLCTPLDLLSDKMLLPRADIGDIIVIFQSGAYGLTASPRHFLSHPDASEVFL